MANTSSRTLRLLSLLQTHRFWPGPELADRLGVTDRTLRRDIDRLRELGYPVRSSRGADGGYQLAAGATMPPLVVDAEEAVAIVVALRAATQGAAAVLGDAPVRALAKVTQVLPKPLRKRVEAVRQATVAPQWGEVAALDVDLLTTVATCCRDTVRLEFGYTGAGVDAVTTQRRVEPHHLVPLGRRWYLVAWDLDRQDWRSFRLDRMADPRPTLISFRPREVPGGDPASFVQKGVQGREAYEGSALVAAPSATVTAQLGRYATVTVVDDARCRITMSATDWSWMCFALTSLPHAVSEIEPAGLRDALADWRNRLASMT